jgi:hypothetical protein
VALRLAMSELIKATLPQGMGWVAFIGFAPDGQAWHRLGPLDLDQAQALSALGTPSPLDPLRPGRPAPGPGDVAALGGRPGWSYLLCRPYNPPAPSVQGPAPAEAFRSARLAQARATARQFQDWARRQGWWVEIE